MPDSIAAAFHDMPRRNFMPPDETGLAQFDNAWPIGYGQTISQPSTVRMMLEWLKVGQGNAILDVGSGSGWTTALLSQLVGEKGRVYAVEIIPELVEFGRANCARLDLNNIKFYQAGKRLGLPARGPFDRILVSAAAQKLSRRLLDQLKPKGKMVMPVGNSIMEISKGETGDIAVIEHPGFVFVPLVG
jgi:protein-L-isoaspartate(D-aspartate) O-methyltransferase